MLTRNKSALEKYWGSHTARCGNCEHLYNSAYATVVKAQVTFVHFFRNFFPESIKYECKNVILIIVVFCYSWSAKYSRISLAVICKPSKSRFKGCLKMDGRGLVGSRRWRCLFNSLCHGCPADVRNYFSLPDHLHCIDRFDVKSSKIQFISYKWIPEGLVPVLSSASTGLLVVEASVTM